MQAGIACISPSWRGGQRVQRCLSASQLLAVSHVPVGAWAPFTSIRGWAAEMVGSPYPMNVMISHPSGGVVLEDPLFLRVPAAALVCAWTCALLRTGEGIPPAEPGGYSEVDERFAAR